MPGIVSRPDVRKPRTARVSRHRAPPAPEEPACPGLSLQPNRHHHNHHHNHRGSPPLPTPRMPHARGAAGHGC
ncbi:hypothetical protein GZL_00526 [Streptomyces sp. 769]|nr:hypothetical protein GZL_00526 [Streptomyces sp. 769]